MIEVLRRFDLFASFSPFRRCLHCNAPLQAVPKELIHHRLLRKTEQHYDEFHICRECDRIYCKGSHDQRMQGVIARVSGSKRGLRARVVSSARNDGA